MSHDICLDHEQDDGTEVFRCRNCGLVYTTKGAFDIFVCKSIADTSRKRPSSKPPESLDFEDDN